MFNFKVKIKDLINKDYAHNPEDGFKIAQYILDNNKSNKNVEIDFSGISTANTAFCNVLYDVLKNKKFKITFVNCNELIYNTILRVKENSERD